jgi:two-component system sensor histidine kinase UhpB
VNGLRVDLRFELGPDTGPDFARLSPELEDAIYRIVQEALTNVVKHATTSEAKVLVSESEATLEVTVSDHGGGFDSEQEASGFGLVGIRERVALLGGAVSVVTSPGDGTTLRIAVPKRSGDEAEAEKPRQSATL